MDIQSLSVGLSTQRVQEQVGTAVLGMALGTDQAAALAKLLESVSPAVATDPALGNNIDMLA